MPCLGNRARRSLVVTAQLQCRNLSCCTPATRDFAQAPDGRSCHAHSLSVNSVRISATAGYCMMRMQPASSTATAHAMAPVRQCVAAAAAVVQRAHLRLLLTVVALAALPSAADGATGGGSFTPTTSQCAMSQCPNVSWSNYTSGGLGVFTVVSSPKTGSNNYVSFAFATGVEMEDAILVVDCYEPNGTVTVGTSLNTHGPLDNSDKPDMLSQLSNVTATRSASGVLTCSFTMNFPSSSAVYVFLAEGTMANPGGYPPKKRQHDTEYVSPDTLRTMMGLQASGAVQVAVKVRGPLLGGLLLLVVARSLEA